MAVKPKSRNNLGALLQSEFCGDNGVAAKLWSRISQETEVDKITDAIAGQWDIEDYGVSNYFENLENLTATSLIHKGQMWNYMLKVAQCAALANKRVAANLQPLPYSPENPHTFAIERIYQLGANACALLPQALADDLLGSKHPKEWSVSTLEGVAELCVTPYGFRTSMTNFARWFRLPVPLQLLKLSLHSEYPQGSILPIYRLSTAAALLDQELQIEFVPYDYSAGEADQ